MMETSLSSIKVYEERVKEKKKPSRKKGRDTLKM